MHRPSGHRAASPAAGLPARKAWVLHACAVLLLVAQWLLASHAPHDEHGHGGDEPVPACAICLFAATGQDVVGPLPAAAPATVLLFALMLRLRGQADDVHGQPLRSRRQARGPPRAARR